MAAAHSYLDINGNKYRFCVGARFYVFHKCCENLDSVCLHSVSLSDNKHVNCHSLQLPIVSPVFREPFVAASVHMISVGFSHCLFTVKEKAKKASIMFAFGSNFHGELGNGISSSALVKDPVLVTLPVSVGAETEITSISAGMYYSACVDGSGYLYTWGCGAHHKLGHASVDNVSSSDGAINQGNHSDVCIPTRVEALASLADFTQFMSMSTRIKDNSSDNTGMPVTDLDVFSDQVIDMSVVSCACGVWHTLVVVRTRTFRGATTDSVYFFGWNVFGQANVRKIATPSSSPLSIAGFDECDISFGEMVIEPIRLTVLDDFLGSVKGVQCGSHHSTLLLSTGQTVTM